MSQQFRNIHLTNKMVKILKKKIRLAKDKKTADRLRVVWFKSQECSHNQISKLLGIGINQVTKYLRTYLESGLEALSQNNYKGTKPKLSFEQMNELKIELLINIYVSAVQIAIWIEDKYNIYYSISGIQKLLKKMKFTYKKNRLIPSKADPKKQEEFIKWFNKKHAELGEHDRIYFGDAAHPKHNAEVSTSWSEIGNPHLILSNTGRKRFNILGAYCTQTHEHVFILTEENINQDKMIELLEKIHEKHRDGKIYLILDNASYNRALRVRSCADLFEIMLEYLPSYSPNLNLIERLWKLMRKKFFKNKYRETFDNFKCELRCFFDSLGKYQTELKKLLTEKFETLPSTWHFSIS